MVIMLSAICFLVGLYFIYVLKIYMKGLRYPTLILSWFIGFFYFLYIPFTLIVFAGGYDIPEFHQVKGTWGNLDVSTEESMIAAVVIVFMLLSLLFTAHFFSPKQFRPQHFHDYKLNYKQLFKVYRRVLVAVLAVWSLKIYLSGGVVAYFLEHWYYRHEDNSGVFWLILDRLFDAVYIVFCAVTAIIFADAVKQKHYRLWLLASAVFMLLMGVLVSGNRIHLVLVGLYVLPFILIYNRKLVTPIIIAMPVLIIMGSYWANIRSYTDRLKGIEIYTDRIISGEVDFMTPVVEIFEGVNILVLFEIVKKAGSEFNLVLGETYLKSITWIIPRSMWPEKPLNAPQAVAALIEPGERGWSVNFTQFGEAFFNFGMVALAVIPIMTIVIVVSSNYLEKRFDRMPLKAVSACLLIFWMSRSVISDNLILLLFTCLIIWGFRLDKNLYYSTPASGISSARV